MKNGHGIVYRFTYTDLPFKKRVVTEVFKVSSLIVLVGYAGSAEHVTELVEKWKIYG